MTDIDPTRLTATAAAARLDALDDDWTLCEDGTAIERRFACRGFAKAVYLANLAAWHADRQGHHPDIAFGFGYCTIRYTTHDAAGLTGEDFTAAAELDRLIGP